MADGASIVIQAAIGRALIRAMGMLAESVCCAAGHQFGRYEQAAFEKLIEDEGIGWNAVQETLRG